MLVGFRYTYRDLTLLFVLVLSCTCCQREKEQPQEDRISFWLNEARSDTLDPLHRKAFLDRAYTQTTRMGNDSLKRKKLSDIAFEAYELGNPSLFKKASKEALHLAMQIKDTLGIADTHWNYGAFYLDGEVYDSAYYHYHKAQRLFEVAPHPYYSGKMLYNMAMIQGRLKDYTASEVLLFRAIAILEPLQRYKQLYYCYNLLGVVYEELDEPDRAVTYYKKSLEYLEELGEQPIYLAHIYNNIGVLYRKQENQPQALSYFEKALSIPNLKSSNISLYARLIDNRAYSRLLAKDTVGVYREFYRGLHLRDSLQNQSGIIMSKLHLAKYYAYHRDTVKAIVFAKDALHLAREIQNNRDILKGLLLLSNLDKPISNTYLQEYIGRSKAIRDRERKARDKFTRVQYETDRYVERTRQLSSQKLWILIIGIGLLLVLSFLYILHRQRSKNRMLYLETQQQKANEQVYLLTLKQHDRLQKVLNQQRIRISEELHDAILGELFAIRMNWGLLPLQGDPGIVKEHRGYLKALQHIEKQIREASHDLMQNLIAFPLNFIQMVERLAQHRCKPLSLTYKVHHDENIPWGKIDLVVQTNLYRIIEEALQNCIRHARATHVDIRFTRKGQVMELTIRDDGQGFNPRKWTKGIGLIHIRSRVQKLRGKFWVHSGKGQGTALTISVPVFKNGK